MEGKMEQWKQNLTVWNTVQNTVILIHHCEGL